MPVLTDEQQEWAQTVRRVARERIAPIAVRMEAEDRLPMELLISTATSGGLIS
jgi:alkylation response protein AidB-like acyl-CoA dehydrogenase